jgi:hypothetical protein
MPNGVAPTCPISFGQLPYGRQWLGELINSIPRAHDLPSVLHSLSIINNVITQIARGEPQVNNVFPLGGGGAVLKGADPNPNYEPADWIEESRRYQNQKLINPDDTNQFIEFKVLRNVGFANRNTGFRLVYQGPIL